MKLDEIETGSIVYKFEKSECSEGWSVPTPVVDKITSVKLNPYPQYEAFVYFQNSGMVSLCKDERDMPNVFKTEEELMSSVKNYLDKQLENIK